MGAISCDLPMIAFLRISEEKICNRFLSKVDDCLRAAMFEAFKEGGQMLSENLESRILWFINVYHPIKTAILGYTMLYPFLDKPRILRFLHVNDGLVIEVLV